MTVNRPFVSGFSISSWYLVNFARVASMQDRVLLFFFSFQLTGNWLFGFCFGFRWLCLIFLLKWYSGRVLWKKELSLVQSETASRLIRGCWLVASRTHHIRLEKMMVFWSNDAGAAFSYGCHVLDWRELPCIPQHSMILYLYFELKLITFSVYSVLHEHFYNFPDSNTIHIMCFDIARPFPTTSRGACRCRALDMGSPWWSCTAVGFTWLKPADSFLSSIYGLWGVWTMKNGPAAVPFSQCLYRVP